MKSNWIKPSICNLNVKNTFEKPVGTCPECGKGITHPDDFNNPSNHTGRCSQNRKNMGGTGGTDVNPVEPS